MTTTYRSGFAFRMNSRASSANVAIPHNRLHVFPFQILPDALYLLPRASHDMTHHFIWEASAQRAFKRSVVNVAMPHCQGRWFPIIAMHVGDSQNNALLSMTISSAQANAQMCFIWAEFGRDVGPSDNKRTGPKGHIHGAEGANDMIERIVSGCFRLWRPWSLHGRWELQLLSKYFNIRTVFLPEILCPRPVSVSLIQAKRNR